jgi:plastocyanin
VFSLGCLLVVLVAVGAMRAQETTITARVALVSDAKKSKTRDASNVVVWLTPSDGAAVAAAPVPQSFPLPRLIQRNKSFEPHVLVVRVGSLVEFPNRDPFFHNVFSLFEGKRFDLGLYEAGTTRNVLFDKPGISYIFCNIHPEMSAVVLALNTPYYGISDRRGQIIIPAVAPGRYTLRIWYEATLPERLNAMAREVTVSESTSTLGLFQLPTSSMPEEHKNMYGRDYPPPNPDSPAYVHP